MKNIYVTGHRNPDMDSVASAWAYARLKNIVDKENNYVPIRLGPLNDTTKDQFQKANVEPPSFVRDVHAKVEDVYTSDFKFLHPEEPIFNLMNMFQHHHSSVVPLLDNGKFEGLLSVDEISAFFLQENADQRPVYEFLPDNFAKVIKGKFIKTNDKKCIAGHIITGAMEFDVYSKRVASLFPKLPVLVIGYKRKHIEFAVENQFPAIILTGLEENEKIDVDISSYKGVIYQSYEDTAETIRLLRLSLPVKQMIQESPPRVYVDDLFDDAKRMLTESEYRGLPVFDDDEKFVGFVTRRRFLERPRRKVIMVDHNELNQSIEGLEEGEIIEIIDHHRLDAERTSQPIFIAAEPVGSTCTIVYHQYRRWDVEIDPTTARILMGGIIADTVILKSPTTTEQDRLAIKRLSKIAGIEDIQKFGEDLFTVGSVLSKEDPEKIITSDFKIYEEGGIRFGIGQVEVTTLDEVDEVKGDYFKQLELTRSNYTLNWAMLLVTDVITEDSILIMTSYPKKEKAIGYPQVEDGMYLLKGVLSRKKQLLPEIIRVLEEVV